MKKGYVLLITLLLVLVSCEKKWVDPYPFENGKRSKLVMLYPQDARGYYQVPIDTTTNSNRFDIYVEATKLIPFYWYNGVSVMNVKFDCNVSIFNGLIS